jgi:hypothetical protein
MANIKLNFAIICDNAFVAQGSNSLNIIGIFDRIITNQFPAMHPRLVLVISVSGDVGEYNQIIRLKNIEGSKLIAELKGKLIIHSAKQKAQFIGNFFNLVFPLRGEYVFEIEINDYIQELKPSIYVGQ